MGFEKIKRPILSLGAQFLSSGASTSPGSVAGDLVLNDTVRAAGLTLTAGLRIPTEAVTLAAGDQTISRNGASFVTLGSSGAGRDGVIQAPSGVGQVKYIFLINNTTSSDSRLHTNATANTFWGTTFNTAALSTGSTGSPGGTPAGSVMLGLVAQSTTQWALFPGSTFNWDLSASTGSTSIA